VTDTQPLNGQPAYNPAQATLLADVGVLQKLLFDLQNHILFCSLNPHRPLPAAVLADVEDRLGRLLTMVRGQMEG
jgi:hypothetical protein